jgi:regulator of sigma D
LKELNYKPLNEKQQKEFSIELLESFIKETNDKKVVNMEEKRLRDFFEQNLKYLVEQDFDLYGKIIEF